MHLGLRSISFLEQLPLCSIIHGERLNAKRNKTNCIKNDKRRRTTSRRLDGHSALYCIIAHLLYYRPFIALSLKSCLGMAAKGLGTAGESGLFRDKCRVALWIELGMSLGFERILDEGGAPKENIVVNRVRVQFPLHTQQLRPVGRAWLSSLQWSNGWLKMCNKYFFMPFLKNMFLSFFTKCMIIKIWSRCDFYHVIHFPGTLLMLKGIMAPFAH